MRRLSKLRSDIESWRTLSQRTADALELAGLGDDTMRDEIAQELSIIDAELEDIEFASLLSGKYDADSAILAIHAGAGRNRFAGLGADARENVPSVGGEQRLPNGNP